VLLDHLRETNGDSNAPGLPSPLAPRPSPLLIVELTLARMAAGGIHDQIGGGFCRYSVDERWEIPHFEKMLYDNAQLLPLYARGARAFGDESHARVARELLAG
jgi:uncharacterized protein YyaL (SSP411 family)